MISLFHFVLAGLVLLTSSASASSATLRSRATTCNGHAELCSKGYGTVTYVGTHDSYAIGTGGGFNNQDQSVTTQLNDGVRMLQSQAHNLNGTLQLCHTSCNFQNGGTLIDYLKTVKSWMDSNPNDVVTLLIVNIDNQPPSAFDAAFKAASADTISFAPQSSPIGASDWPTLGSIIDSGKRLITFLDNQADITAVPYLIDEFTNVWETAFDVTNPTFDCAVNRTKGDASTQMYLINHFLDTIVFGQLAPNVNQAGTTNSASGPGSLQAQVDTCVSQNTRPPNFMLIDYYEFAGTAPFEIAAKLNGVTFSGTVASPVPSGTGTSSPGSSQGGGASPAVHLPNGMAMLVMLVGVVMGFRIVL